MWVLRTSPSHAVTKGDIEARDKGSLVAHENGVATPFGIAGAQSRGIMMVSAKEDIYRDMIIGLHQRPGDLRVNICKVRKCVESRPWRN